MPEEKPPVDRPDVDRPDVDRPDVGRLVDEAARAVGLPIDPQYRANVILNVERSLAIVQPLLAVELDDELTPGPVFRP